MVYDLTEKPQIPSINVAMRGRTWERYDAQEPHYRAVFDDKDRIMVFICHNTDLGDGWEDATVHDDAEAVRQAALRMGANIVVYALTR